MKTFKIITREQRLLEVVREYVVTAESEHDAEQLAEKYNSRCIVYEKEIDLGGNGEEQVDEIDDITNYSNCPICNSMIEPDENGEYSSTCDDKDCIQEMREKE